MRNRNSEFVVISYIIWMNLCLNFMLHMRESGVMVVGTILLNFWPKCMNIMGLCTVYTVIMQSWVVGAYFRVQLCSYA